MLRRHLLMAALAGAPQSPREYAEQLSRYYGHDLDAVVYIPAVALIARIRLGALDDARRIAEPWVDGSRDSLAKATASHFSGHLVFAELAERTKDPRYVARVRAAADFGFAPNGEMKFHNEMSDAVFMGCPILAKAGKLTGEKKYFEMAARHFAFMESLCKRPDGLYRHSPLCEVAWGRGNAFPLLGLALTLADFPEPRLLTAYQNLARTLAGYQDNGGMWHQVIDVPASYPEFSCTAMIATSYRQGIRNGWLPSAEYQPRVTKAWDAIRERTSSDGTLTGVCESTGKQKTLDEYLNRKAITGRDPRGGAMALLLSTELAGLGPSASR